ncbi:MAG: hypothetical protein LBD46_08850 [Endomicrobium sp.]|jgi:hypothetical protein|nr:hypothetical protein [Endomicrobium sp.]
MASLSVSPSRVDIRAGINESIKASFMVTNNYEGNVNIEVLTNDWNSYKGNNINVNSWLNIETKKFVLAKGESKEVFYTIITNQDMQGSVSGQVTFSLKPPGNDGITIKMSFPIYIIIKGTEQVDFNVEKIINVAKKNNGITASFSMQNNGNVHVRPQGKFNIYNKKDKLVASSVIPERVPVYANTSRSGFYAEIPDITNLKAGKYIAEILVETQGQSSSKKIEFRIKKDRTIVQ